ncbi:MAG: P-loop NTPase, partial [Proteobacteria bacterium]|nr:P-loop NTPase [Pseudomonadota bacterium]
MSLFKDISDRIRTKQAGVKPPIENTPIENIPNLDASAVNAALGVIMDPDLGKDIVTLGFVRNIQFKGADVSLEINLTTPACPVKESMKAEAEANLRAIPGIGEIQVTMTATTRGHVTTSGSPIAASLGGVRNIIAVASGKGGVGKSTTSVNLAYALAASGSRVGLLDADVYGPSIPFMTRPDAPMQSNSSLINPPLAGGVKVMSIGLFAGGDKATIVRGPMASGVIKQFLTQVNWGELDYLVIDYPPGTGDIQLTLSQTAPITGAVVVTTPQDVALIDVRKAIA